MVVETSFNFAKYFENTASVPLMKACFALDNVTSFDSLYAQTVVLPHYRCSEYKNKNCAPVPPCGRNLSRYRFVYRDTEFVHVTITFPLSLTNSMETLVAPNRVLR